MNQVNPPKKESNSTKQTNANTSEKDKSKPSETVSSDSKLAKSKVTNKSASQTSISHFSSVSTPEYREGWNRIFGGGSSKGVSTSDKGGPGLKSKTLSISDDGIDLQTRKVLCKLFRQYALRQGVDLGKIEDLMSGTYALECKIKEIK